ncbi:MAG: hypothetical protein HC831_13805 [Chloroflexia bacterium]|nr:hypothetical protein [Chloroflexia bacterium]
MRFIKIPPLVDFNEFKVSKEESKSNYFLFCGSIEYREIVDFIIDSYLKIEIPHNYKLNLVLSGPEIEFNKLKKLFCG